MQTLSDGVTLIAAEDTWIEGKAVQQLETTARLAGMRQVAGMPDLHPGRGYPVGAAFFSVGCLYPALVGNDIGCGMALWQTGLSVARPQLDKLDKRLGNLDEPLDADWDEAIAALGLPAHGHRHALGTIGGGNHFAELQQVDAVHDAAALAALGIEPRQLLLLVHSGSRGLGEAILREHVDQFGHAGLAPDSEGGRHYLARHADALRFARANRHLIAQRMLARLRSEGTQRLDVDHNFVAPARIAGEEGWLHRKGATPSNAGSLVIPGSRGDYSYLVQPLAGEQAERSLFSLAHGAGRKWMRSDCKARLATRYSPDQLARTALGGRVICGDRGLIYEEAPEAYKAIDSVIGALQAAGLLSVLARLKPVLSYKMRGCC